MKLVIVTGMSGAGKSTVLNSLEDAGYYCTDNLPAPLMEDFVKIAGKSKGEDRKKIAIGADVRDEESFEELKKIISGMKEQGVKCELLFLDASDEVLIKRYKETRRRHPLAKVGRLEDSIKTERNELKGIREYADYKIDTSHFLPMDLKKEIKKAFIEDSGFADMYVTVISFGFKYGIPADADLVFDVRFLPNPYWVEELKHLTGRDKEIVEYLESFEETREFIKKLEDMISFMIPYYIKEEKHQLDIAIGCTGGRHRSVMMAETIAKSLKKDKNIGIRITHRDLSNDLYIK